MASEELMKRADALVQKVTYKENYALYLDVDKKDPNGRLYLQVKCWRPDVGTGQFAWGAGGKTYLGEHMTDDEIMKIAFGLFRAYEEHECREFFKYNGRSIFGPHISIEALYEAAAPENLTYRD